ncbi:MAG TPA: response regulator [Chloroflexota bacterium]
MANERVLVVDDEPQIRRALRIALKADGYEVTEAETGQSGLAQIATRPPDLVILDLGLPDLDGVNFCQQVREWTQLPIIVLTARNDERSKVVALDEGANDYVTKPFSVPELLARMRASLRDARPNQPALGVIRAGDIEIDLAARRITRAGSDVHLTPTEYALLRFLALHAGRLITHGLLLRSVFGPGYADSRGSLRVHIASLRKKLEADPSNPQLLLSEPGVGYRFTIPQNSDALQRS